MFTQGFMDPVPEYFSGVTFSGVTILRVNIFYGWLFSRGFHWSSVRFGVELCVHLAHFFYVNTLQGKGGYGDTGCGGHRKRWGNIGQMQSIWVSVNYVNEFLPKISSTCFFTASCFPTPILGIRLILLDLYFSVSGSSFSSELSSTLPGKEVTLVSF